MRLLTDSVVGHPHGETIDPPDKLFGQSFQALRSKGQVDPNSDDISADTEIVGPFVKAGMVAWLLRLGYRDQRGKFSPPRVLFVSQQ